MNHRNSSPAAPLLQSTPPTSPPRLSSETSDAHISLLPQPLFQKISTPKPLHPTIKNKMAAPNLLSKSDTDHIYHSLDEEDFDLESQAIIAMRRNQMVLVRVDKVLIIYYVVMLILLVDALVVLPIVCYNLEEYKRGGNQ